MEDVAGIPTAAGTAWQALFEAADLQRGQAVLVHAGAGGVSSFAIQFACNVGARVVATASGAGMEVSRQLGADQVIDYRSERFEDRLSDLDVVLVTVRDDTQQRSFGVLRPGGILFSINALPDEALAKTHRASATFVVHQSDESRLEKIIERIDVGTLRVLVGRKVALAKLDAAFRHQGSGRARGEIILSGRRKVKLRTWGTAHTRGDQVIYLLQECILFAGDLIEERMFPIFLWFPPQDQEIDDARWVGILNGFRGFDPVVVVPGHEAAGPSLAGTGPDA